MKKALIVDDDDMIRTAVGDLLKRVNFKMDYAEDGWEGVRKIKSTTYDLIVLDIKMPSVDGEQVLNILKKQYTTLPVVILSGFLTKSKLVSFQKLDVKGFVTKPIDIKKFYQAVNIVCPIELTS
ncbi:response regulator [candidate division KSB1 bacterium]